MFPVLINIEMGSGNQAEDLDVVFDGSFQRGF